MDYGFDLNSYVDNLSDDYGVFDDVADSLDFASVGISTLDPNMGEEKKVESNKKNTNKTKGLVKNSLRKRGRKPGQKPKCGSCGILGHTRRKCTA
jgi:hypothetical protein